MNRRLPEASALRRFFQEQWDHLQQLIEAHRAERLRRHLDRERLSDAVESIVDATDARLRAVGGYQKELRDSARNLLDHVDHLIAAMPVACRLSQSTYHLDPLVNMLFRSPAEIENLFSRTQAIQVFFNESKQTNADEVYALLQLIRRDKKILGAELRGEIIQKEVTQTSVFFTGHRLLAPGATEQEVRTSLKKILLDHAVRYIDCEISKLRYAQSDEEQLAGLHNPQLNMNNPEVYLQMLVKQMEMPRRLIKLQGRQMRLSKLGIELPLDSSVPGNTARLYELEIGEERPRILCLIKYSSNEFQSQSAG